MNLNDVFWAGVGYDSDIGTGADARVWTLIESDIERLLKKCEKMGVAYVPNEEQRLCRCQQYFLRGDAAGVPTFADFHQIIGNKLFRIGFGFIAHTETEARDLLDEAEKFLNTHNIRHRNVSVWWAGLPQQLEIRRLT